MRLFCLCRNHTRVHAHFCSHVQYLVSDLLGAVLAHATDSGLLRLLRLNRAQALNLHHLREEKGGEEVPGGDEKGGKAGRRGGG